jgi:uncharacterized membrane protein YcaP (DUF421 family)
METVVRITLVYALILAGLRLLGKREFGQLSPVELITLLLIPELISQGALMDDYSMTNAIIGVATLLSLVFFTSVASHRFARVERWVGGTPTVLVARGRLMERNLNRERIAPGEIYGEMHKVGVERIDDVRWAILETDGRISIVPEHASRPPARRS